MKKLFCVLLALVMTLSLCACSKEQEAEGKSEGKDNPSVQGDQEKQDNVDRYFLYIEDNKLYRLDTEEKNTQEIDLDIPVSDISEAMVCDNNATMVAKINNAQTGSSGVMYLGKKSGEAVYLGDNTGLVRMSRDGKIVFYLRIDGEQKDLYRYDAAKDRSVEIAENVNGVSVSDDGKRAFVTTVKDSYETTVSLYYVKGDDLQEIADCVRLQISVSQDCSAVAYLKAGEEDSENSMLAQAYLWSTNGLSEGKEQKLPFTADEIVMFDARNIYYIQGSIDHAAHYYYDGNQSHRLTDDGNFHGHKAGNYMYSYLAQDEEGEYSFYLAYQGETIKTNMRLCYLKGNIMYLSPDDKCIYGWGEGAMYQVELDSKGELKETELRQMDGYSPRLMKFQGDTIVYPKEQALYMNDQKITEEYEDHALSTLGDVLVYRKGDTLFQYASGKTTEFAASENIGDFYPAKDGKVVSWQEGGNVVLQYANAGEMKGVPFGSNVMDLAQVHTWTHAGLSNYTGMAERTGAWFQRECIPLVWRR